MSQNSQSRNANLPENQSTTLNNQSNYGYQPSQPNAFDNAFGALGKNSNPYNVIGSVQHKTNKFIQP